MIRFLRKSKNPTAPPARDLLVDGLPPMGGFLYPERPPERKRSFFFSLPIKIAGGIACSLAASMIVNAASLKDYTLAGVSVVKTGCSAVLHVFGDPFEGVFGGGKPVPGIVINAKTPEQVEAERKAERAELVAEADLLGLSWREDWSLEKLRVEVKEGRERRKKADREAVEAEKERKRQEARERAAVEKERAEEAAREAQRAAEAVERAELVARATAVGFGVDATLPLRELRRQVEAKEAAVAANEAYQRRHRQWEQAMAAYNERVENGKNAVCPNCRMWMHISPSAKGITAIMCRACKLVTSRDVFRAGFNPPPPPVEPLPPEGAPGGGGGGFFSSLKGGFE